MLIHFSGRESGVFRKLLTVCFGDNDLISVLEYILNHFHVLWKHLEGNDVVLRSPDTPKNGYEL